MDDIRVQILQKVHHSSEKLILLNSFDWTRELYWSLIQLNHMASMTKLKGSVPWSASHVRRQTSTASLINNPDEKDHMERGTAIKELPQPDVSVSTLVDLVDMTEKPEGVRNINTKLFSILFPQLHTLQELALESTNVDYFSAEYRVTAIIHCQLQVV